MLAALWYMYVVQRCFQTKSIWYRKRPWLAAYKRWIISTSTRRNNRRKYSRPLQSRPNLSYHNVSPQVRDGSYGDASSKGRILSFKERTVQRDIIQGTHRPRTFVRGLSGRGRIDIALFSISVVLWCMHQLWRKKKPSESDKYGIM